MSSLNRVPPLTSSQVMEIFLEDLEVTCRESSDSELGIVGPPTVAPKPKVEDRNTTESLEKLSPLAVAPNKEELRMRLNCLSEMIGLLKPNDWAVPNIKSLPDGGAGSPFRSRCKDTLWAWRPKKVTFSVMNPDGPWLPSESVLLEPWAWRSDEKLMIRNMEWARTSFSFSWYGRLLQRPGLGEGVGSPHVGPALCIGQKEQKGWHNLR